MNGFVHKRAFNYITPSILIIIFPLCARSAAENVPTALAKPAHETTEESYEDEDPTTDNNDEGKPIKAPITSILVWVVRCIVLPLMEGHHKLGTSNQPECGDDQTKDVIHCDAGQPAPTQWTA